MILKASCMHNPCYIDRLITSFMRVLQRMAREHLTPSTPESSPGIEKIIGDLFFINFLKFYHNFNRNVSCRVFHAFS